MTDKITDKLKKFRKLDMSILPTALHKLEYLSRSYKRNIYCKRDDLTGFAFGGNKTRKLDYLVKDALDHGHDCIVTNGSVQSNWCRICSVAAAVNGIDIYLVLAGHESAKSTANLLLDELAGADISIIDTEDDELLHKKSMEIVEQLEQQGKKPYFLSVGGSNSIGALGYVQAFNEILEYEREKGIDFSKLYLASGSAGTQAGLVVGQLLSGWEGKIIGINVSRSSAAQEGKIGSIVKDTLELLNIPEIPDWKDKIITDDNYIGEAYRKNTEAAARAIELFARKEGIFLDEVYTGKAAAGLLDHLEKGLISSDEDILFIHTGGNIQLFE